jgi:uncharacterized protein (UPF0276 family)
LKVGIGYRQELAPWVASRPSDLDCLEITAEDFYRRDEGPVRRLAGRYPLVVHTSRLSLGTPGPLDRSELEAFAGVVAAADPLWVSDHLGFRRSGELDLGCPNPISLTRETLARVVEHAREIMERCQKRLLLENITSHLSVRGAIPEPDFLNRFCEESGGGILLDLTGLVVSARNHGFEPRTWLRSIEAHRIVQVHVGSFARRDGRWVARHDGHVDEAVWGLVGEVLASAPPEALILERHANFPPVSDLAAELRRLKAPRGTGVCGAGPASPLSAHP